MNTDYEILEFKNQSSFRKWLDKHFNNTNGIWLRMYKKASGIKTITHQEALDIALCYGWIDSLTKKYDDNSYIQKFTPRRPKSLWSQRNIEHIERLIKAGLMTEAGLLEVTKAKNDGRWQAAYDAPKEMKIPDEFLEELKKFPKAYSFFETLAKSSKFVIGWQLQTAKTEDTRKRRSQKLIELLKLNQKP